ncbi:MAG: exosortase/archaeosortase family protein [Verrucomicrobiota bacterium]|nr:exosortase/archaeosortase family protein [Verrucomicrobiota bacterium]
MSDFSGEQTIGKPGLLEEIRNACMNVLSEMRGIIAKTPSIPMFLLLLWMVVLLFEFYGNSTMGYLQSRSLFNWTMWAYEVNEDDSHGYLIPWVVLGLLWWKRAEITAVHKRNWGPGLLILAAGLLLHLTGFLVQQARISIIAFFLCLYGIIGVTWGAGMLRAIFFPFFLFAFCVPLGTLSELITFPLRLVATKFSSFICDTILGINLIQRGTQIFSADGTFQYEVAAACSGLRSLTAIVALATIYGFMTFQSAGKRALVILAAFPLALAGNIVRLTTIIIVAEAFGQKYGNLVHDNSWFSMLPYLPAIGGLMFMGWVLRDRETSSMKNSRVIEQPA